MKGDVENPPGVAVVAESKLFVGRFVRRQGQYGTVAVVGRISSHGVELLDNPKKLFPREGLVEAHGLLQQAGLHAGDWVEFGLVKNTRPRAPEYKVFHLHRLPRYTLLSANTPAHYKMLLTKEGWRGDARPGLWALRISSDKVLVVELELGEDGALRIPRKSANDVRWYEYADDRVVHLCDGTTGEDAFLADSDCVAGSFDWSDEADHVAQVIRSLSDVNDPLLADLISWLELHHEAGTGRIVAAALNHGAAEASLRSGELAERLRADRELMKAYLGAALQDDAVREAVAEYAREGHGAEADRLREELACEIAAEKARRIAEIEAEAEGRIAGAIEQIDREVAEIRAERQRERDQLDRAADEEHAARLKTLEDEASQRRNALSHEIAAQEMQLAEMRTAVEVARGELKQVSRETDTSRERIGESKAEIDRLLAIADRLGSPAHLSTAVQTQLATRGVSHNFARVPKVAADEKGKLVAQQVLLTEQGKNQLLGFMILLLSGELPLLTGPDVSDFLQVAESLICPGRAAAIEADPTMISIDDLWSRPGSGAPTAMADAADSAKDGAVLVALRGIERSGARFWVPALGDALRGGGLPRGLLVCCVVHNRDHEEVEALPEDLHWLEIADAFTEGAFLGVPSLLKPPMLELTTLDPGPMPADLPAANQILANIGFKPTLGQAMRIARMFTEASTLLGDVERARHVVIDLARAMSRQAS